MSVLIRIVILAVVVLVSGAWTHGIAISNSGCILVQTGGGSILVQAGGGCIAVQ